MDLTLKCKKKDNKGKQKPKWKCYHCGKEGHIKKYCYDLKRQNQKTNPTDPVGTSNCLAEVLTVSETSSSEWIMDSGCSFHMSPNLEWFHNFDNNEKGTVYMGNNHSCKVEGIGDISLKLHDNNLRILTGVRYVPNLKRNLISLGTLDEQGLSYKAEKSSLFVFKNDKLVLSGTKKNGLYVLNGCCSSYLPAACTVKSEGTDLWHLRLGHMSLKGMQALSSQGYLGSLTPDSINFCESCILGK